MVEDEVKERKQRASGLRQRIREITSGERRPGPPRSPREFIEEKMREEDSGSDEKEEDKEEGPSER